MNRVQLAVLGFMSLVLLGVLIYPEWHMRWKERLDFEYVYEGEAGHASEEAAPLRGSEYRPGAAARRGLLFLGPRRPPTPELPAPRRESVGTGFVDAGPRRTTYTGSELEDYRATLNARKLVWEIVVLGGATLFITSVFRSRGMPASAFSTASWPVAKPPAEPMPEAAARPPTVIRLPPPKPPTKPGPADSTR
jgi:hypothetical protein